MRSPSGPCRGGSTTSDSYLVGPTVSPEPSVHGGKTTNATREAAKVQERLTKVSESLKRARASERVLLEQVSYLDEVADDAETRKLLAQNPLADREARLARSDRDRHAAQLADSRTEISRLVAERDRLLDRLLDLERTT